MIYQQTALFLAAMFAGFAGNETSRGERDLEQNVTVLSGDLLGNDTEPFVNYEDNCYHVVTGDGSDATAVLDGFFVVGGFADGAELHGSGAGMLNQGGVPTLRSCVFFANVAIGGGGMATNGDVSLDTCVFFANVAVAAGGMAIGTGNPTVTSCLFTGNWAFTSGGGVFNVSGGPLISACIFLNNLATEDCGLHDPSGGAVLENTIFSESFCAP